MQDYEQQMMEQQQMEQQLINEELQRWNDPVRRDVIMGDWRSRRKGGKTTPLLALIIFIIAALLMIGIYILATNTEQYNHEKNSIINRDGINCCGIGTCTNTRSRRPCLCPLRCRSEITTSPQAWLSLLL